MQTAASGGAIEDLRSLLRFELASVALYEEALEGLGGAEMALAETLGAMRREHARNAHTLASEIARLGGGMSPAPAAPRGTLPAGRVDALLHLLACEEVGMRRYEEAAKTLPRACGDLLLEVLVPARRRHVIRLRGLTAAGHGDCTLSRMEDGNRSSPETKEVAL